MALPAGEPVEPDRLRGDRYSEAQQRTIAAALDLFGDHGVSGASFQMIADSVGVTKAAIYHQFKTKDALVLAVVEVVLARLQEALDLAEADHPGAPSRPAHRGDRSGRRAAPLGARPSSRPRHGAPHRVAPALRGSDRPGLRDPARRRRAAPPGACRHRRGSHRRRHRQPDDRQPRRRDATCRAAGGDPPAVELPD